MPFFFFFFLISETPDSSLSSQRPMQNLPYHSTWKRIFSKSFSAKCLPHWHLHQTGLHISSPPPNSEDVGRNGVSDMAGLYGSCCTKIFGFEYFLLSL